MRRLRTTGHRAAEFQTIDHLPGRRGPSDSTAGPAAVVIEACSLAGWVHDLCDELGVPCRVANTSAEAWKYKHAKRKTDRDDALRLAQLEARSAPGGDGPGQAAPRVAGVDRPPPGTDRPAGGHAEPHPLDPGRPGPAGAARGRAWTAAGLAGIAQFARPLAECGPEDLWRGLLELALTAYRQAEELVAVAEAKLDAHRPGGRPRAALGHIPGLGPRTAEAIVAHLDDPQRFRSGKQVAAYGGLVPRQYQSGEDDRRGRITKRGPAVLRKLLVQCAWAMLRYNPWARAVYERLSRGQGRRSRRWWPWPARSWCAVGPCSATASRGDPIRSRPTAAA